MRKYLGFSVLLTSLLLVGCGSSNSSSDGDSNDNPTTPNEKLQEQSTSECSSGISTDSTGDTTIKFIDITQVSAHQNAGYVSAELKLADLSGPFTYNKSNITDGTKEYIYYVKIQKDEKIFELNATFTKDDTSSQDVTSNTLNFLQGSYKNDSRNNEVDINVTGNTMIIKPTYYYDGSLSWVDQNATVTAYTQYIDSKGVVISDSIDCK